MGDYILEVREVREDDLNGLLHLYEQLHNSKVVINENDLSQLWEKILKDKNHHIIVGVGEDGKVISSCVCVVISNLTHNQQPYALIENVITDEAYRKKGWATKCLDYAKEIAIKENCYKIMLMTGSKHNATLQFYRNAGYNSEDKTAFIQWL